MTIGSELLCTLLQGVNDLRQRQCRRSGHTVRIYPQGLTGIPRCLLVAVRAATNARDQPGSVGRSSVSSLKQQPSTTRHQKRVATGCDQRAAIKQCEPSSEY